MRGSQAIRASTSAAAIAASQRSSGSGRFSATQAIPGAMSARPMVSHPFSKAKLRVSASAATAPALVSAHVERLFPDWERRSRSRAIRADIARFGGIVRPLSAPEELGLGGMLGTMYVLEGSRLGARMLLRRVAQSPHPEVREACAYLGHGAGSSLWQSFLAALEFHGGRLSDDRVAVRAAQHAFDLFADAASSIGPASRERIGADA